MATRKVRKQTLHSLDRAKERIGVANKKQAEIMIRNAFRKGKSVGEFPDGRLKNYINSKRHHKKVKVYKGKIFIFSNTSNRCITLYPIPEDLMEEYEFYEKQEKTSNH